MGGERTFADAVAKGRGQAAERGVVDDLNAIEVRLIRRCEQETPARYGMPDRKTICICAARIDAGDDCIAARIGIAIERLSRSGAGVRV